MPKLPINTKKCTYEVVCEVLINQFASPMKQGNLKLTFLSIKFKENESLTIFDHCYLFYCSNSL